jgi:lipopolysaccharide export system permease protein
MGSWLSSFILTPLAVLLTYRATNDIGLINMDVILAPFKKVIKKNFRHKINNTNDYKQHTAQHH